MILSKLLAAKRDRNKDKNSSLDLSRHKFTALLKELMVPPLNTPDGSKFHWRTAAGRNYRLNWSVVQSGIIKPTHLECRSSSMTCCSKILQIFIHRLVHSVIGLIEQTKGATLSSIFQTTKRTLTPPFGTANSAIKQTQMRHRRRHPHGGIIFQAGQNIRIEAALDHTWSIKILSCSATDAQISGCLWHYFQQMNLKRQL